jgi:hypothetical protein
VGTSVAGAVVEESAFGGEPDDRVVVTAPATYMPTSQVIVLENVFIRLSLTVESAALMSKRNS